MTDEYAKQFRSPEEIAADEREDAERQRHEDGDCDPTFCWWCEEARERGEQSNGG